MSLPEELLNLKLNLKNLLRQFSDLTTDQNTLKSDVTKLKSYSSELKSDFASLKHEFAMVQSEFAYYASLEKNRRDSTVLGKHKINFIKKNISSQDKKLLKLGIVFFLYLTIRI